MFFRKNSHGHKKERIEDNSRKFLRKEEGSLLKHTPKKKRKPFERTSLNASLTVETALALPVFLYLMAGILMFFSLIGKMGAMESGIQDTAKQMAVYAYTVGKPSGNAGKLSGGVSAVYAWTQLEKCAYGLKGFHLGYSSFMKEDDKIDLVAVYQADREVPVFSFGNYKIVQRGCVRAWTGRDFREQAEASAGQKKDRTQVYVAENGVVYHKDPKCTHLRLSIRPVSAEAAARMRNRYGAKYAACSCCKKGTGGTVYITDTGNRYHADKSCSGLKRTVHSAILGDVENLPPCSKCGG